MNLEKQKYTQINEQVKEKKKIYNILFQLLPEGENPLPVAESDDLSTLDTIDKVTPYITKLDEKLAIYKKIEESVTAVASGVDLNIITLDQKIQLYEKIIDEIRILVDNQYKNDTIKKFGEVLVKTREAKVEEDRLAKLAEELAAAKASYNQKIADVKAKKEGYNILFKEPPVVVNPLPVAELENLDRKSIDEVKALNASLDQKIAVYAKIDGVFNVDLKIENITTLGQKIELYDKIIKEIIGIDGVNQVKSDAIENFQKVLMITIKAKEDEELILLNAAKDLYNQKNKEVKEKKVKYDVLFKEPPVVVNPLPVAELENLDRKSIDEVKASNASLDQKIAVYEKIDGVFTVDLKIENITTLEQKIELYKKIIEKLEDKNFANQYKANTITKFEEVLKITIKERSDREAKEKADREAKERSDREANEKEAQEEQRRLEELKPKIVTAKTKAELEEVLSKNRILSQYYACNIRYNEGNGKYDTELKEAYTDEKFKLITEKLLEADKIIDEYDNFKDTDSIEQPTIIAHNAKYEEIAKKISGFEASIQIDGKSIINDDLFEILLNAARVLIRTKTIDPNAPNKDAYTDDFTIKQYKENYADNAKKIFEGKAASGEVREYTKFREVSNSDDNKAPYKYTDVITTDDKGKITLVGGDPKKTYGPFSAFYGPQYNNWDIYYEMFGQDTIEELKEYIANNSIHQQQPLSLKGKRHSKYGTELLQQPVNLPQNLLKKLVKGGNVVIFGYGLSGSGKTWTTVEGSIFEESRPMYDPSLLELFIREHFEYIKSIEFVDIYPFGEVKLFNESNDPDTYGKIEKEGDEQKTTFIKKLVDKLIAIGIKRRQDLRVLATPNNDSSSRSFLQITVNIKIPGTDGKSIESKLVFFDMPGTENTIKIKQEFMGDSFIDPPQLDSEASTFVLGKGPEKNFTEYHNFIYNNIIEAIKSSFIKNNDDNYKKNIKESFFKQQHITCQIFLQNLELRQDPTKNTSLTPPMFVIYIAKVCEELNLFFNGYSEKTFEDLNGKWLKFLNSEEKQNIVKTFFRKTIFKAEEPKDGNIKYKYFTLTNTFNDHDTTIIDENTKNNIKIIFNLPEDYNNYDQKLIQEINTTFGLKYSKLGEIDKTSGRLEERGKNIFDETKTIKIQKLFDLLEERERDKHNAKEYGLNLTSEEYKGKFYFKYTDSNNECVMIKYMVGIINILISNEKNKIKLKEFIDIMLIFIYKYVDFIVKQGSAIVTTLEHLKFFFLSNTSNVEQYNQIVKRDDTTKNKAFDGTKERVTKMLTGKDENDPELTYTIKTNIKRAVPGKEDIPLDEKVFIGKMNEYKLLGILQELAGRNTNLQVEETKTSGNYHIDLLKITDKKTNTVDNPVNPDAVAVPPRASSKSLFLMLLHLKVFDYEYLKPDQDPKIPQIITDSIEYTLDFGQAISSATQGNATPIASPSDKFRRAGEKVVEQVVEQGKVVKFASAVTKLQRELPKVTSSNNSSRSGPVSTSNLGGVNGGALSKSSIIANTLNHKFNMIDLFNHHNRPKTHRNITHKKNNRSKNKKLFSFKTKKNN